MKNNAKIVSNKPIINNNLFLCAVQIYWEIYMYTGIDSIY